MPSDLDDVSRSPPPAPSASFAPAAFRLGRLSELRLPSSRTTAAAASASAASASASRLLLPPSPSASSALPARFALTRSRSSPTAFALRLRFAAPPCVPPGQLPLGFDVARRAPPPSVPRVRPRRRKSPRGLFATRPTPSPAPPPPPPAPARPPSPPSLPSPASGEVEVAQRVELGGERLEERFCLYDERVLLPLQPRRATLRRRSAAAAELVRVDISQALRDLVSSTSGGARRRRSSSARARGRAPRRRGIRRCAR